jgi:hypothetical protein
MDFTEGPKQNLSDIANRLEELTEAEQQPAPVDWARMRKDIRRYVVYMRAFVIPEVPELEPGYKSGNGLSIATYIGRDIDAKVAALAGEDKAPPTP